MIYYYKRINTAGNIESLISCDQHLEESAEQIEITETEYAELYASLPQPEEPETNEATESDEVEQCQIMNQL